MADNIVQGINTPNVLIITDSDQNQVMVTQPVTNVIQVNALGPQGATGPQGPTGSLASTNSGSFAITGSLTVSGSSTFTNIGPAIFSGSVNISGSAFYNGREILTTAITGGFVTTSSFNAFTSSINAFTASYNTGSFTGSFTGIANLTSFSASSAVVTGNVTVLGTASINTLIVNQTQLSTGSNQLGDAANDTQTLYGTVRIPTGSLTVSGSSYFSGSVGIGTSTPLRQLHVIGDIEVTNGIYGDATDHTFYTIASASFHHRFYTRTSGGSSLERFTIQGGADSGSAFFQNTNVGIGTTTPTNRLEVKPPQTAFDLNALTDGTIALTNNSSGANAPTLGAKSLVGSQPGLSVITGTPDTNTVDMLFSVRENDNTDFTTLTTPAFRFSRFTTSLVDITRNGNVGIGIASPSARLHVSSSSTSTSTILVGRASGQSSIKAGPDATGNYLSLDSNGSATLINHYVSDSVWLASGGGSVAVGHNNPLARLHVKGTGATSSTTALLVQNANASSSLVVLDNGNVYSNGPGFIASNTAFGFQSLNNPSGSAIQNTAFGYQNFVNSNYSGFDNVAIGYRAIQNATTGYQNMGIGTETLQNLSTGAGNTAVGHSVLRFATVNNTNTGIGFYSLYTLGANQGNNNTGIGGYAFQLMTTGSSNIGIGGGSNTFRSGSFNIFIGAASTQILSGSGNVIIGNNQTLLSSSLDNTIAISDGSGNMRIYVSSSGNVGIGTTTPSSLFTVNGTSVIREIISIENTSNNTPNYTSVWSFSNNKMSGFIGPSSLGSGGLAHHGYTATGDNSTNPLGFTGITGGTSPTVTSLLFRGGKSNGVTGVNPLASNEIVAQFRNWTTDLVTILGNGNVGIGTITPSASLHISGSSGSVLFEIDSNSQQNILFVSGSGNVGIGTSTPGSKLVVVSGTDTIYNDGTLKVVGDIALNSANNLNPGLNRWALRVRASGSEGAFDIYDARNSASRLFISGSGNVGIGTTSPSTILHVYGTTPVRSETPSGNTKTGYEMASAYYGGVGAGLYFYPGGPSIGNNIFGESANNLIQTNLFQAAAGTMKVGTVALGTTQLYTNSLPRLTVASTGEVGIGTTTPSASLHISGASSANLLRIDSPASSNILYISGSGNVGIGTSTPGQLLTVVGNGQFGLNLAAAGARLHTRGAGTTNTSTSFRAENASQLPALRITDDLSARFDGKVSIGSGLFPTASLEVSGTTLLSGSAGTGSALTVYKSGSTVMSIQGSQGELFSITDSLSGSLFSVSNISGLPILEVFSDNTVLLGSYLDPMLMTTQRVTANSGSTVIYSLPTASYDGVFVDYVIRSGSNARAGQFMGLWSGSATNYTDNSTTDFGSTTSFTFGLIISGSNMVLTGSVTTGSWTVRAGIRSM